MEEQAVEMLDKFEFAAWSRARDRVREPMAALTAVAELIAQKYGMGPEDKVDPQTGAILRAPRENQTP